MADRIIVVKDNDLTYTYAGKDADTHLTNLRYLLVTPNDDTRRFTEEVKRKLDLHKPRKK